MTLDSITSRERKQQVFKWPHELSPPNRSTSDEYRCQRLAELISLPAHAGIGLRKKILDVVLPWAAEGNRGTIQKKQGASAKKPRIQAISRMGAIGLVHGYGRKGLRIQCP
jgi:hypothetical protein